MKIPVLTDEAFIIYLDGTLGITGGHNHYRLTVECTKLDVAERGPKVSKLEITKIKEGVFQVILEVEDPVGDGGLVLKPRWLKKVAIESTVPDDFDVFKEVSPNRFQPLIRDKIAFSYTPTWLEVPEQRNQAIVTGIGALLGAVVGAYFKPIDGKVGSGLLGGLLGVGVGYGVSKLIIG